MLRATTAFVAVGALAVAIATSAFARPAAPRVLRGTVGPGFTIKLTLNGKKVKTLKAGRYKLVVADRSSFHNFELERESGAKFERDVTKVPFVGTRTITVTLSKGQWKYYCEPHEGMMVGFFRVT